MAITTAAPLTSATLVTDTPATSFRYLEWGPVILGTLGASAISVVLLTFGAALGLTVVSPYAYAGISAKGLAVLAATYAVLVQVASFGAGGYLAGRMRTPWAGGDEVEQHFRDGGNGFAVWALGIVVGATVMASGIGSLLSAAATGTTAIAAAGTAGAASNPALAQMGRNAIGPAGNRTPFADMAVDRLLAPAPAATPPAATPTPLGTTADAPAARPMPGPAPRGDIAAPMTRTLVANLGNTSLDAKDRTYLAQLVAQQTGIPQADAEKRVDDAYAQLKAAEQKAREAADQARKATLLAAFLAAAALAVGCAAACGGAALGARHRDERTLVTIFGSRRFW